MADARLQATRTPPSQHAAARREDDIPVVARERARTPSRTRGDGVRDKERARGGGRRLGRG